MAVTVFDISAEDREVHFKTVCLIPGMCITVYESFATVCGYFHDLHEM